MRVIVLHSTVDLSSGKDEEDTLVQVESILRAFGERGDEAVPVPFSLDFKHMVQTLDAVRPDFVFNLVETVEGTGRLIHTAPAILDHLGVPYSGATTEGVFLTSNKLVAKKLLHSSNVPTPPWFSPNERASAPGLPVRGRYIVKSVWEHASIGLEEDSVVWVESREELFREVRERRGRFGGDWFAEAFVEGREFNLSLLGSEDGVQVLPPAEMRFEGYPPGKVRVVGYKAKWDETSFEYRHTCRSFDFGDADAPLLAEMTEIARKCWRLFDLRGYARVDFRVDESSRPRVLEVNANPCLSPDAGFMAAARAGRVELGRGARPYPVGYSFRRM